MDFHSWAGPPWLQALSKNDRPLQSSAGRINIAEMAETSPMPARYSAIKDVFPVCVEEFGNVRRCDGPGCKSAS